MKRLSCLLVTFALGLSLAMPAWADILSPGEVLVWKIQRRLPLVLLIAALVITAILVRKFTKKK